MVTTVESEATGRPPGGEAPVEMESLWAAVGAVEDPEMAVGIGDLGMVLDIAVDPDGTVRVDLVSTYAGCPAQLFIERDVEAALAGRAVRVSWLPRPWSPDDVTAQGRRALADIGIAVPAEAGHAATCPYCGSPVTITSRSGSSLCRSLAYCDSCRNPVDVLKHPGGQSTPVAIR